MEKYMEKCPHCDAKVYYSDGDKQVKCLSCGQELKVVDFVREQQKIEQCLAEGETAKEALEKATQEQQKAQEALCETVRALDGIETEQRDHTETLNRILSEQQFSSDIQNNMLNLLRAIQGEQENEQGFLDHLMQNISAGQRTADKKLASIGEIADQLLQNQNKTDRMISVLNERLTGSEQEKQKLIAEYMTWSNNNRKEDIERLNKIRDCGDSIQNTLTDLDEKIKQSRTKINSLEETAKSIDQKWSDEKREKLIKKYRLAEKLQKERRFDEAQKHYQDVLINGGRDPEVYWRVLMCHYCIEYQKNDEKEMVPTILYPDLSDPSDVTERSNLLEALENADEELQEYYHNKLEEIDSILEGYRRWRYKLKYDVFISVKQTDETDGKKHPTEDFRVGMELYDHLTSLGLKVFNSEKTKGPAGKEWEPYILAALMSARVMIVVGTCPEYMESQWVKNEWTRFQWLQKYERDEKKERVLFCYLSGGMKAERIPKALNPNKQAIIDGIHAQTELDAVIKEIFPPEQPPIVVNESEKKTEKPPITEKQLLDNWEAWLRLGRKEYIEKIKTDYDSMVEQGEHLTNPTFHLLSLCAENRVRSIRELPKYISDLQKESKFLLAERYAVSEEDRRLIDSLKKACAEEKNKKKAEKKNKAYAVISLISALVICAFLIALYFVEPNADVMKRDTHIEAILLGGAAVVALLAFVLFRILRRLSQSKCTMANSETRLYGLVHLCVCLFALGGVLNTGENIWNGWVLGVWAHYYEQYTIHLVEIYIFAASILISATGAIMTIVQRNRNSESD